MDLVCPGGNLPALKAAVDGGADAVYLGFRDQTNARAFPGLNFSEQDLKAGVTYAHLRGCKVYVALNTYPGPANLPGWQAAVDRAAAFDADAVICADPAVLEHAARRHPSLARHLSVQGSATTHTALRFYLERFGIARAVLPRVLSLRQVESLCAQDVVPVEVFAFGSLCIMVEGRCQLSSFLTGEGPNRHGACSPPRYVRWEENPDGSRSVRLNGRLLDRFAPDEPAGYPTVCKGRYRVNGELFHALEEPTSLNTLDLLPRLQDIGVAAVKIEGRQRGAAYVSTVTKVWRAALDRLKSSPGDWQVEPAWQQQLARLAEGRQTTLGPYHRSWH
jgi:collagenase-like PrtC family protease